MNHYLLNTVKLTLYFFEPLKLSHTKIIITILHQYIFIYKQELWGIPMVKYHSAHNTITVLQYKCRTNTNTLLKWPRALLCHWTPQNDISPVTPYATIKHHFLLQQVTFANSPNHFLNLLFLRWNGIHNIIDPLYFFIRGSNLENYQFKIWR
jgi:hypothetical protein